MKRDRSVLVIDDASSALIGWFQRCGQPDPILVYDYEKLVKHFMGQGMDEGGAVEWISHNVEGAWMGEGTPAILHRIKSHGEFMEFCDAFNLDAPAEGKET